MVKLTRFVLFAALLSLAGCAGESKTRSSTAAVKDACAASYGPGTRGFDLCLRGNYPAAAAGSGGY